MKVVLLLVAMTTCVVALPNVANFEITDDYLASFLKTKEDLVDFITEKQVVAKKRVTVRSFSYQDCGGPDAMLSFKSLDISPDPLAFPGPLNIAASIDIKSTIDTPVTGFCVKASIVECRRICQKMVGANNRLVHQPLIYFSADFHKILTSYAPDSDEAYIVITGQFDKNQGYCGKFENSTAGNLTIYKKVLGKYVKLPCIDNFGSCVYEGLCVLFQQIDCPSPLVKIGIDCRCPFKANTYTLPKTEFDVVASLIPTGDYHFIGNATMRGNVAACLDLVVTVE